MSDFRQKLLALGAPEGEANRLAGMAAPNINARVRLLLRINGANLEAKLQGNHDGFPAYEFYVEGQRIYQYDPVAVGAPPATLGGLGDGEDSVDTQWYQDGIVTSLRVSG